MILGMKQAFRPQFSFLMAGFPSHCNNNCFLPLHPLPTSWQDQGGAISLDAYMRLPPDQYDELDPGMIQALGGSQFLLKVPRLAVSTDWAVAGWR
jgi:hypothetical protein